MRRRSLACALLALAVLAGCNSLPADGAESVTPGVELAEPPDVRLQNDVNRSRFVRLTIYAGEEQVGVLATTLDPGGRHVFERVVAETGSYRVEVETGDGLRTTRRWTVTGTRGHLELRIDDDVHATRATASTRPPLPGE